MKNRFWALCAVAILGSVALSGCGECEVKEIESNPNDTISFDNIKVGAENTVYLMVNKNSMHYACLKKASDDIWSSVNLPECSESTSQEVITFKDDTVTVTDKTSGAVAYTDTLPTIEEISVELNITSSNPSFLAHKPFKVNDYNTTWDRKAFVVGVLSEPYSITTLFMTKENNNAWKSILLPTTNSYFDNFRQTSIVVKQCIDLRSLLYSAVKRDFIGKSLFCIFKSYGDENGEGESVCFDRDENGSIVKQTLFGEAYPKNYEWVTNGKNPSKTLDYAQLPNYMFDYSYFFDKQNRLHILYMEISAKGNYINYEMYKDENQTTPTLTQNIYL